MQQALQIQEPAATDEKTMAQKNVRSGNDKVSLSLYGQINRGGMFVDDGNDSDIYHVDNANSSTRFGMKGSVKANDNLTAGFNFEAEFQGNSSYIVTQATQSSDASLNQRHMNFYLNSDRFGKISIGQGDTASNGTSEIDLSGTMVVGFSNQMVLGGAIRFYDALTGTYSSTDIDDVINHMDGLSRKDRLRYDTPAWHGLSAAIATVEQNW